VSEIGEQERALDAKLNLTLWRWMALTLTPGMGPTRIWKAMSAAGAAERLFEASLTELGGAGDAGAVGAVCL
jgi:DNA processing protein